MNMPSHTRKRRTTAWRLCDRTRRHGLGIADASGATAVEFALLLPVFIGIVFGLIEIGRVLYTNHSLDFAVREATRYAIVRSATSPTPATTTNIEDVVKARTTGLDPAKLAVAVSYAPDNSPGSVVTVQVSYNYQFLIPMYLVEPISLTSSSQMIVTN